MVDEVADNTEMLRCYLIVMIKINRYFPYAVNIICIMTYYRPVRGSNFVSHPGGRAPSSDITL